jgi:hypothetical protein
MIMEEEPFRRGYIRGQIYASRQSGRDDEEKKHAVEKP